MRNVVSLAAVTTLFAILLSALPCLAIENQYTEDFSTAGYKDSQNTTAWWNTLDDELSLYPFVMTLAGNLGAMTNAAGVAVAGDYAYVADDYNGLLVVDISDPTNPWLAGDYNTPNSARDVAIAGDRAYVADFESGLQVLDISNPTGPTFTGSYDLPGPVWDVAVAGDHAYLANAGEGLRVIDISDPTTPTLVGSYDTPGFTRGVTVDGNYAYMGDGASGLQVIDISDPANPDSVGTYDTPGTVFKAAISGNFAYLADGYFGLQVVDISNPTAPTFAGSYNTSGKARDVAVNGDYAYVSDSTSGLQVIDISDPTNPTLIDTYGEPGDAIGGVALAGDYAFVGNGPAGLLVIDIADLEPPEYAGSYDMPGLGGTAIAGDYAYVTNGSSGLRVIDISEPTAPAYAGICNTLGSATDVAIAGNYAYVADLILGLAVVDITNPMAPTYAGECETPGEANMVAIAGDYAYVADGLRGIQIIDISDPTNPDFVATYDMAAGYSVRAADIAIAGDYAYVVDYNNMNAGLQVVDISDPATPTYAGNVLCYANDVTIAGDYVYVAGAFGLGVIDISDPTAPARVGDYYGTGGNANAVATVGNYAFVADRISGLQVIDISDPTSPASAGTFDTLSDALHVAVAGDYAYVTDVGGLQVIQVHQRFANTANNRGQSGSVTPPIDEIARVRLSASTVGSIDWEVSVDNGANWQSLLADGAWTPVTTSGDLLEWRSTHTYVYTELPVNPTCTSLDIEWLYSEAIIDSVVDVPGDQGGWVRVCFTRSGRDFVDELTYPILSYYIWRRIDDPLTIQATPDNGDGIVGMASNDGTLSSVGNVAVSAGIPIVLWNERYVLPDDMSSLSAEFPPGTWEIVGSVPGAQQEQYISLTPSVADSLGPAPQYSVYFITAHTTTPSVFFTSSPDSGYSVDNLAPGVPEAIVASYQAGSVTLDWNDAPETDFQYFRIYRDADPGFVPSPDNLVHETAVSAWTDPVSDPWGYYYKIATLDYAGNESEAGSPTEVTGVQEGTVTARTALLGAVPNPFNPMTKLAFQMAAADHARLKVYDTAGRLVATLVDENRDAGSHTVIWDGRDNAGRMSSAGVYLYRLEIGNFVETKRMTLIK